MSDPLIASGRADSGTAVTSLAAPSLSPLADDILLVALVGIRQNPGRTLSTPSGWTHDTEDTYTNSSSDVGRLAMFHKPVSTASPPYADVFTASDTCFWGIHQLAFKATGTQPTNSGHAAAAYGGCPTAPTLTALLSGTPTSGNVLVAAFLVGTCGGPYTGTQEIVWPAGWTDLGITAPTFGLGRVAAAYKVSDGTETGIAGVYFDSNNVWEQVLTVSEYAVDPAPVLPGLFMDWSADGFGSGAHDNISSDVASWSVRRGASPELTGGSQPGGATFVVINRSDLYNPENSGSAIASYLRDGVPVWLGVNNAGTLSGGTGVNGLFGGRITDISPLPEGGADDPPKVEILCEDPLAWYSRRAIRVADALDRSQADLRLAGLTAAGETRYDLPDEPRGLPLSSYDGMLLGLLDGINGANGTRHFAKPADDFTDWYTYTARNRMYKVGAGADASLDAGSDHVTDVNGWRKTADGTINEQRASFTPLTFPDFRSTVWEAETLPITGTTSVDVWATFDDYVTDAEVEITSSSGATASLTSFGRTAKITLTDTTIRVERLIVTGRKVQRGLDQSVVIDDTASQADPRGVRAGSDISGDLVGSAPAALGIATAIVWRFASPQYRPTLTVQNWLPYQFQLDLFDLIEFTSSQIGVTARLFEIVGLEHASAYASEAGVLHITTYTLQECRQQTPKTWLTWDSSVWDGADVWAYL